MLVSRNQTFICGIVSVMVQKQESRNNKEIIIIYCNFGGSYSTLKTCNYVINIDNTTFQTLKINYGRAFLSAGVRMSDIRNSWETACTQVATLLRFLINHSMKHYSSPLSVYIYYIHYWNKANLFWILPHFLINTWHTVYIKQIKFT